MYRVAVFMCLCLVRSCNTQDELYEGGACTVNETVGVCTLIINCKSALEALKADKRPEICSFSGLDPIVCCLDKEPAAEEESRPQWTTPTTTTPQPPPTTTATTATLTEPVPTKVTEAVPTVATATVATTAVTGARFSQLCPPIPPNQTAAKTGQKAWDKCIEYQERLVMPCDPAGERRLNYCRSDLNTWILNGEDAYLGEFPHMALVGFGSDPQDLSFLCGGTLISERFVMTAGHCTSARNFGPISYVLLGVLKRSEFNSSLLHRVRAVHKHPQYTPPKKYNDIALLELETPVPLSDLLVPACLDVGDRADEATATATGWGNTMLMGSEADILQKVDLERFSDAECTERFPVSRLMTRGLDISSQICYGHRTRSSDTCQGDSGGPLQVRHAQVYCMYTVIGVTSFGRLCGIPGEPALYTRVATYVPWIEGVVWPDTTATA